MINKRGGAIPETYGVPVEEIQEGIRNGVRKVNIDTDNRLAFTAAGVKRPWRPQLRPPPLQQAGPQVHEAGLPRPLSAVLGRRQRQQDQAGQHHPYAGLYAKAPWIPRLLSPPDLEQSFRGRQVPFFCSRNHDLQVPLIVRPAFVRFDHDLFRIGND